MSNGRFRVNFGQGQVSHRFSSKRAAAAYINDCKSVGDDPYASRYFIEERDADGWWMPTD